MFSTRSGFEVSKDESGSYMYSSTFFVDEGNRWGAVVEALPEINSAIERNTLTEHVHIGYGPGMLSISFHSDTEFPEEYFCLGKEIEAILKPIYEDGRIG